MLAALSQGWMLGRYITGFERRLELPRSSPRPSRWRLPTAYVLLGASWLIMKTEGELQQRARRLGAPGLGADGAGHGADLAGHALDQRHGARALVRAAGVHRAAADPAGHRDRRCSAVRALLEHAARARAAVLAALRAADRRLRARLPRPGLQPLPLRRDRPADDLAGRQQPRGAEGDPVRRAPSRCRPSSATRSSRTACSAARRAS